MAVSTLTVSDSDDVSAYQMDALREYLSLGVGVAASTLNEMLGMHVELEVPDISLIKACDSPLVSEPDDSIFSTVSLRFSGNIQGTASVIFDPKSAIEIFALLMPGIPANTAEMDEICESTIIEVGNIVINSVMGSLANSCEFHLTYELPRYSDLSIDQLHRANVQDVNMDEDLLIIYFRDEFNMGVERKIHGKIILFCVLEDLGQLLAQWQEPDSVN